MRRNFAAVRIMGGEPSLLGRPAARVAGNGFQALWFLSSDDEENDDGGGSVPSLDALPDDLLETILSFLPISCIFRVRRVCRKWNEIIRSRSFSWNRSIPQPWYFMFTCNKATIGYAHDPLDRRWYGLDLPCIETSEWFISSSNGLVCFVDNESRNRVFVCNPITRAWKRIDDPPCRQYSDFIALSVYVGSASRSYTIAIVESNEVPGEFLVWDISIHVYDSRTRAWATPVKERIAEWRAGSESVICGGVLYCLLFCTRQRSHSLLMYNLSAVASPSSGEGLLQRSVPAPCFLTCGRLMNLKERLIMVGGIAKPYYPDNIKGIGVWELEGGEWREVSRMPRRFFQGFGDWYHVFLSGGSGDLIYVQNYDGPRLLVFDMNQRQWRWSVKYPAPKRVPPSHIYSGFSFVPRLDVSP